MTTGTSKDTARLEAFSDAVFAIAVTVLVIELRIPDSEPSVPLRESLVALWPSYVAYLAAFLTIFVMWLSHHGLLLWVRRVDGSLLVSNGLVLMLIALVPFPTRLVGNSLRDPGDAHVAVAVFAGLFLLISLAFGWLWLLVVRKRKELAPSLPRAEVRQTNRFLALGIGGYAVAVALAFVEPRVSIGLSVAMVLAWLANAYRRHQVALEEST